MGPLHSLGIMVMSPYKCLVSGHCRLFFQLQGRLGVEAIAEQVRTELKQPA